MRLPVQQAPPQPTKTLPPLPPPIKLQEPIRESPRKLFGRKNKAVQAPPPPPPPPQPAPVAPPMEQHRNRCGPHSHLHSSSSRLLEAVPAEHPQPLHFQVGHYYQWHVGEQYSWQHEYETWVRGQGGGPRPAGRPASARRGIGAPQVAAWEALPVLCRRASCCCYDPAMRCPPPALCAHS